VRGYNEFLAGKRELSKATGFDAGESALNTTLFDFQRAIVLWALHRGSAAIFAGTGLGKTAMQLEWARLVEAHTHRPVLILAPLAVAQQTVAEGARLGIPVAHIHEPHEVGNGLHVTNYDRFDRFDPAAFGAIVLDESSILKAHGGKTRTALIEAWEQTRFRLACTATPAPNDLMEIANHAEFLGVMTRAEMLATFFVHDGGETQKWRLKGHAEADFWKWMASWSVMATSPTDLGFDGSRYVLPPLTIRERIVESAPTDTGALFALEANTLQERRGARRASIEHRVAIIRDLVAAEPDEAWMIWCDLNDESEMLASAIPTAVEVRGSDSNEHKERAMLGFASGSVQILVSKPSICGFGMNFQRCSRVAFCGLSDSWEAFYQAMRRCYRFGQTREVVVHIVTSSAENAVLQNIKRKERDAQAMTAALIGQMQLYSDVLPRKRRDGEAMSRRYTLPAWLETSA